MNQGIRSHEVSVLGRNVTRTSLISFLAFLSMCSIFSSIVATSATVIEPGTLAVRSTNIKDPARRARKWDTEMGGRPALPFWVAVPICLVNGSRALRRDRRVRGETPASVRSPRASMKRPKPCLRMTIETSRPDII